MKIIPVFGSCLLAGASILIGASGAFAQTAPGPTATVTCAVLDNTCGAIDATFIPSSVKVSVTAGITTATCSGLTTNKPSKPTKCNGETLGGVNGETTPIQPCVITLGTTAAPIDDWTENISPSGKVTLACKSGGKDPK